MADLSDDEQIVPVPPPWKLKATVYMLSFWSSKGSVTRGKDSGKGEREHGPSTIAYSPLEAKSPFADPAASGEHLGGLSQIQILRYTESPVGTYDELIICPGSFAYEKDDGKGKGKRMKSLRITRIYVSRKKTCWNGRSNWNIPKHLARFEWNESPDGKMRVRVYPRDSTAPSDGGHGLASEPGSHEQPFFQATFQPIRWTPSFPFSLSWLKYAGIDTALVQPPLPNGRQSDSRLGEELVGTSRWCEITPTLSTRKATLGWIDMSQHNHNASDDDDDGDSNRDRGRSSDVKHDNFWPGLRRWNVAIKMENADITFDEGVHWCPPLIDL